MERVEVTVGRSVSAERIVSIVEATLVAEDLRIRMRGTLRTYPGSVHWHLEQPGARGTIEVTWWPNAGRLWLAVHAGRRASWIEAALPRLQERLERALG
jgi:hypothetical protein